MARNRSTEAVEQFTLKGTYLDDLVSPNFTVGELLRTDWTGNNWFQSDECLRSAVFLARTVLQPLRDTFGPFTPNSVYRCPELNKAVGGSPKSQHMLGQAADIEIPKLTNYELAEFVSKNMHFDQVILEKYIKGEPRSGWVHISRVPQNNRFEVLSYTRNSDKKWVYVKGLIT